MPQPSVAVQLLKEGDPVFEDVDDLNRLLCLQEVWDCLFKVFMDLICLL